jgi:hypothetical protein
LFPGPNYSCQQPQEHPIRYGAYGSFNLSAHENHLLAQERAFCHEFRLASGKVGQDPQDERSGGVRFSPVYEAVVERLQAKACQPFFKVRIPCKVYYPF